MRLSLSGTLNILGLQGLFGAFGRRDRKVDTEPPLRSALLSIDQLRHHAGTLAASHAVDGHPGPDRLLPRLAENEVALTRAYDLVTAAAQKGRRIAPAADWLVDNFYLIAEQIRTARRHLPRTYSRELPRLRSGPLAGYPRVYAIALELISHADGRVDIENLGRFVIAYQAITPLRLGELWAIPIMLRLALIENLRRVSVRIGVCRQDRDAARLWADRILKVAETKPRNLVLALADMVRYDPSLSSTFVAEFARRLRGQNPGLTLPLGWLEQRLAETNQTVEQLIQIENQNQAADQVSMSNSIGSLRFLSTMDWREFVETMSLTEHVLRDDPAAIYGRMDFATRDRYRHVIEETAKRSSLSEDDVARRAIQLARDRSAPADGDNRSAHVGYYLVDKGRPLLERAAGVRACAEVILRRIGRRWALPFYGGGIVALAVLPTAAAIFAFHLYGLETRELLLLVLPLLLCAGHLSASVVNWLSTLLVSPRLLPRMDFSKGIPPDFRTMVVVPTLLTNAEGIRTLLESLELCFLANRDFHLHFALLTDFSDAPHESMQTDEELIGLASKGIEALNHKYASERQDAFFLFHRPRRRNDREGVWMGWERKRGKLAELNALLRSGAKDRFSAVVGEIEALPSIRFVITLDTDTQLPRDAARELVGSMAHPLNRPRFDSKTGRVVEGYGILQPRVGVSLPSSGRSWFARLFAAEPGIDPYTRAVSDVYQDLFGEGSYIGKGIYDVDAFEQATGGRFPENRILSHDLIEGSHARSGLVSDVVLLEEHPASYMGDVKRRHRWIRGDWQITPWVFRSVPGPDGRSVRNCLSVLSRWKILDNLRRSLTPVALMALVLLGWSLPVQGQCPPFVFAFFCMAIAGGVIFIPVLFTEAVELLRKTPDLPFLLHLKAGTLLARRQLVQVTMALVCLPYEAFISLDAIATAVGRVLFTRRKLLEWQTAGDAERRGHADLTGFFVAMRMGPIVALGATVVLSVARPGILPIAGPILVIWFLSPVVAWWLSRPILPYQSQLKKEDRFFLQMIARRTWRFFETFVGPADYYLPPDNYQEDPISAVAHRTSPTNIGLSLLTNLAAHDFGYISTRQLIDRSAKTFATMGKLERYRGHFYNWYDTRTLHPLTPLYVSSVDSGNLAGHLLTLSPGLMELRDATILPARTFEGLNDTLRVFQGVAQVTSARFHELSSTVLPELARLQNDLLEPPRSLTASYTLLDRLTKVAAKLVVSCPPAIDGELQWWAQAFERQCRDFLDDMLFLVPWCTLRAPAEFADRCGPGGPLGSTAQSVLRLLNGMPTLREVSKLDPVIVRSIDQILVSLRGQGLNAASGQTWLLQLKTAIVDSSQRAGERLAEIEALSSRCQEMADFNYDFLYDNQRHLLSIGYNVTHHCPDPGFYDLLASEARLASFVAIAQGRLPQEHWFSLGRLLTATGGEYPLLSWGGSMFEYLMPLLIMPTFEQTLLDRTVHAVVNRQIEYGRQRGVPWGTSESGYNLTDAHLIYQYRSFGVPGLGLKRELADELVVAPYASALALMVAPEEACANLRRLAGLGLLGAHGFYEAIDFTSPRVPHGRTGVIVRSFMAHHEGMSFLAMTHLLLNRPMQRRFQSDPLFRAAELLLQERVPKAAPFFPHDSEATGPRRSSTNPEEKLRVFSNPQTTAPEVHLLSNGRYHIMVSAAGGGYSRWQNMAVTRWKEDATRDCWGAFCYLRDLNRGTFWSAAFQPTLKGSKTYAAVFSQAQAEFRRNDDGIETRTEITVSPEDDIELRRFSITNRGYKQRRIELTSYAEVVMAASADDATHPAFSKLFVQTEIVPSRQAILCTRRPRSGEEHPPWMFHLAIIHDPAGVTPEEISYETDRSEFIGRGRTLTDPAAMHTPKLSNSDGFVLDPIVSIRRAVSVESDETVQIAFVTGVAETREAAMALVEKYQDRRMIDRVFELAWTHSQVAARQLGASESDTQLYGSLAGPVLYANSRRRAPSGIIARNRRGQSGLWGYGITGDLPIVLLRISDQSNIELVRQLIQAHAYWRMKGLTADLVILNDDQSGYRQPLQDEIMGLIAAVAEHPIDRPGGILVRRSDQISDEDKTLIQAVARVVITDTAGTLAEQVERRGRAEIVPPRLVPIRGRRSEDPRHINRVKTDATMDTTGFDKNLVFSNGLGGFTPDGREYVITITGEQTTPAPWVNVMANADFGTVVTESGSATTWSENAHEFRLTPWTNDPVSGPNGEVFYIRDEETGYFWSPTPLPARGSMPYTTRHGFGYSVFETTQEGVSSEMWTYVATDAPVKFYRLKIRNASGYARRLSVTGFVEWVLGEQRSKNAMHIVSEVDQQTGAVLARNPYNSEFPERTAFFAVSESSHTMTADRTEFLGRNGTPAAPAAMDSNELSGRVGCALDPCAAIQVAFELNDGGEHDVVFILGAARDETALHNFISRFADINGAREALEGVWAYWSRTLGAVHVETPDPAVNFLVNGWLLYQTLASRIWARSGLYQSGGAIGFRDQLQDTMALLHAEPRLIREHLLRSAAHQFREGDVQHWWHPPLNRGVRTRISDDYLWLPYAVSRYVSCTGDSGVLDESVHFLEGRAVRPEEDSYYDLPVHSEESATLYEHCVRAITNGLKFGEHGLPLMGCGDWNDGMNRVGDKGKGESVWLAFFLYDVLKRFKEVARLHGDLAFAENCEAQAERLRQSIEEHAWDGRWYRRAYFDNGEPLGSASNSECQIDSLPQSWSILSGAADPARSRVALDAVSERLVRRDSGLVLILDPPFDRSDLEPGYIKGYSPGVRENGGQYTHAAVWAAMAFATLGDSARAWELLTLINPIEHGLTPAAIQTYKVEPYVVAADVYSNRQHVGRGGWTWYTGSAGWMYRLLTESLLGLRLEVDHLRLEPCLPQEWKSLKIHYRYRETVYHIVIHMNGANVVTRVAVDGNEQPDKRIPLVDDKQEHNVEVDLG